jgi:imidazolonepropionase-like amidohydrolase
MRATQTTHHVRCTLTVLTSLAIGLTVGRSHAGPEIPGEASGRPLAIVGATVHTVSGKTLEDATIVIRKGKIAAVGKDVKIPKKAERFDAAGKHVYPGLFSAHSNIGLVEINSVRATLDEDEAGSLNPNVKAWVSVNPDSEIIPTTRSNGVLLALTAPSGGLISGQSAVLQLDGWTYEDLTLEPAVGMHLVWPAMAPVIDWETEKSAKEQVAARDKALRSLREAFDDARAYGKARSSDRPGPSDARWEAMQPLLAGEQPLIVAADDLQQILAAVAFAVENELRLVIYGGYDAPACAELLKKHDVPVIISDVYRLPLRRSEPYDTPFTVPKRLHEAGVTFCIAGGGRFGASMLRNLPYHAAMAAAFGLPEREALRSITLSPAEILRVADRVGSLDEGKDATLIITDGDPLETTTTVEAAFVQGRPVDLDDRHKRLYRKYSEKYRRQDQSDAE